MIGRTLAHYKILEKIGEGGMGEVWKAVDTTLDREVAIKVLPEFFAKDPDRLARFEREAKVLASLNHSGIAVIHGLHETAPSTDSGEGAVRFLAMEYVPGEDLAERLQRGPLSVSESLFVGAQVAEALEAAHAQGVIHRDLKPGNIVLTPDGKAKVLDFGLAKSFETEGQASSGSPTYLATVTSAGTAGGVLLGTAAYMSPEQARGKPVDRRTDIWAFGCVLYECLTAHGVYRGDTVSDSLGAILHKEPDWNRLPEETPPAVRLMLRRCLTKDAGKRLHDIADARIELEAAIEDPTSSGLGLVLGAAGVAELAGVAATRRKRRRWWVSGAALVGLAAGLAAGLFLRGEAAPVPVRKLDLGVSVEARGEVDPPAISPDGSKVAYIHSGQLWVQFLDELEPRLLDETDDAIVPFWSPDSEEIAYFSGGKLWKIAAAGGRPVAICDLGGELSGGRGASWGEDGRIVFTRGTTGLLEVAALGGEARELLALDEGDSDFHEPSVLPGDKGVLFVAHPTGESPGDLHLLQDGERRILFETENQRLRSPVYATSGQILFLRTGSDITDGIWALPFSLSDLSVEGEPFLVVPDASAASVSADGTLAFVHRPPSAGGEHFSWFDRSGRRLDPIGEAHDLIGTPVLSPDGRWLAFIYSAEEGGGTDLWVRDLARGTETRLTRDAAFEFMISWAPSGREIIFSRFLEGEGVSYSSVLADGSAPARRLGPGIVSGLTPDGRQAVAFWDPDGDPAETGRSTKTDIFLVTLDGSAEPQPLIQDPARDYGGWVSPDGRLVAYVSDRSGRDEIFLTRFPDATGRWQVSVDGGTPPVIWDADSGRLHYVEGSRLMGVTVGDGPEPRLGKPEPVLSDLPLLRRGVAISPDGERIVAVVAGEEQSETDQQRRSGIKLVQNWYREFEAR